MEGLSWRPGRPGAGGREREKREGEGGGKEGEEGEEGRSVFLAEMAALCLFCLPLAWDFKMTCLNVPLKAEGSLPVTAVSLLRSAKKNPSCLWALFWKL